MGTEIKTLTAEEAKKLSDMTGAIFQEGMDVKITDISGYNGKNVKITPISGGLKTYAYNIAKED